MTVETFTPAAPYTVAGIGPYAIAHPYLEGSIRVFTTVGEVEVQLPPTDYSLSPLAATVAGNLFLTPAAAAAQAGRALRIRRVTAQEQGWVGVLGEREKGLERQLDRLTYAVQEGSALLDRTLRTRDPIAPFVPQTGRTLLFDGTAIVAGPNAMEIADAQENAAAALASQVAAAGSAAAAAGSASQAALFEGPWLDSAAAVLANTSLGYAASGANLVTAGDYIQTRDGHAYIVAASGATDHHRITAGGVKLYVVPEAVGFNVRAFGAVGTALADDTAEIQAAINAAAALASMGTSRGQAVYLPPGQYLVSSTLTIAANRVALRGAGSFMSQIVRNTNYGSTILVMRETGGALQIAERIEISGMTIRHDISGGAAMTGEHVRFVGVTHGHLRDLDINNGAYGIALYGGVNVNITDCSIIGRNSATTGENGVAGIALYDAAFSGFTDAALVPLPTQILIENTEVFGPLNAGWNYGLLINAAEDVTVSNSYLGNAKIYNAFIEQTLRNKIILEVAFTNGTYIDGAGNSSVRITGAAGNGSTYIGSVSFDGIDIKGQGGQTPGDGIFVDGTARGGLYSQVCRNLRIRGCRIGDYAGNGVWLGGCVNAVIDGNLIGGNNYNNTTGGRGILVGAACSRVSITGGRIGALPEGGGTSFQTYGIELVSGATEITIDGVDVRGNTTGGILDNTATPTTAPATKRITNCPGFRDGAVVPGSPAVPASGVVQYNPFGSPAWLSIFGGTVSDIKLNGQTVSSATGWQGYVGEASRVQITYSSAPSWVWWPQ